jgi:DNA-binding HxlR family transcriptional regulator
LENAGVVERREDGEGISYGLTAAGHQLQPVIEALGTWGARWIPELGDRDYDAHLLLWDRSMTPVRGRC